MKKKSEKILAMVTALCCMASTTACARKVQNASENNNEGFVVVGDKADVNESTEKESSLTLVPRTTAASDSANTSVSNATAATNTAEFVTRSKEEIEKIKKDYGIEEPYFTLRQYINSHGFGAYHTFFFELNNKIRSW